MRDQNAPGGGGGVGVKGVFFFFFFFFLNITMWAGVPSEPLCLHTQSLATAQQMLQGQPQEQGLGQKLPLCRQKPQQQMQILGQNLYQFFFFFFQQQNIVIFFINKFLATIPPSSLQKESYQISYSKQSTKQSTKNILSPTKEANIKCEQNVDIDRTVPMSILQVNKKQFKLPIVRYTFLTKLINGYSKNTDCQLVIAKLACFKITNKFTNKNSKN
eukprot:TRINITY_DN6593_c1_g3_i3.p2 TRINITY_DN6593_c1_g3~~TRINITY_DN6593_c1_g3_i3.p2  ORF type:complete len:242 (-),score=22.66 TRINITY_DN6593_c1_g3_i3:630-1277(-)